MVIAKNVTYALVKQFENFMNLSSLSESTTPKKSQVEQWIQQAEDTIDRRTMHAWRERRFTMEYDFPLEDFNAVRSFSHSLWFDGVTIPLQHRNIKTLDADKGDSLTVRQGSSRVDYLSTKTEGLNADYTLTPQRGILRIYRRWAIQMQDKVRVTYRYGDDASSDVADSDTGTVTLDSTDGFQPGTAFLAKNSEGTISYEVVYINSMSDTVLNVARAQQGTSSLTLAADDLCWQVPGDINEATIKLAAIQMAHNDTLMTNTSLGEGLDYEGIQNRINTWQTEVDEIIRRRLEVVRV
jgi:hypothetical protein